jgi:adenylylsulfate kinase
MITTRKTPQNRRVTRAQREDKNGHASTIVWFTGLSGAGKSTLAHALEDKLHQAGRQCVVLDGDDLRHGLCSDLDFSDRGRTENIRRAGEVAKLFAEAGCIVLAAFISPFRADRDRVRALAHPIDFIEVHCSRSLQNCEQRDPKGLYAQARSGAILSFTGISSPYEAPLAPQLILDTEMRSIDDCVSDILTLLSRSPHAAPSPFDKEPSQ